MYGYEIDLISEKEISVDEIEKSLKELNREIKILKISKIQGQKEQ